MTFADRLATAVAARGPTCVGLDPHGPLLPIPVDRRQPEALRDWSLAVIEAVAPHVAAIKPQVAFYEALGAGGVAALETAVAAAKRAGLLVVLDAKRGDIGSTAEAYAQATLDDDGPLGADAVTLSPWLGPESLAPFLARMPAKGGFVLVRTSNPGAERWQGAAGQIAAWIADQRQPALGAVIGATIPGEGAAWRAAMPDTWFLVPGYGAQGGTAADLRHLGAKILVNSSRAVLFPPAGAPAERDWVAGVAARAAAFAAELRALDSAGRHA
jgi:orotidine-5'-phosphate decarboxylase